MAAATVLFQHQLHHKGSREVAARRQALLKSLPEIEAIYAKALANRDILSANESPEVANEALRFYNSVVTDGRHVALLATAPREAASRLGVTVSEKALRLVQELVRGVHGPGPVEGPVEAVIAIAVVIACAVPTGGERNVVIDSSANVSLKL